MTEKTFKQWPSCRYHAIHGSRIFNSQDELDAAGPGWEDSPAKLKPPIKRRLSRLQRWVLQEAYRKGEEARGEVYKLSKKAIYEGYFGLKCEYIDKRQLRFRFVENPSNKPIILSRSIAKLKEVGYIRLSRHHIVLTKNGIVRAKYQLKYNPLRT